jgi:gluconolactonase
MPVEKLAPELDRLVDANAEYTELASGFGGDMGPAEGPLWWKEGGYLLFSDITNNRRMKWDGSTASEFHKPTNRANGLTRDAKGRLVACEHDARRVTRREADGEITVVANRYHGRKLNRPNDVVVKSDGSIYFSDPITFSVDSELDFAGVFRVSADLGSIRCLARDFVIPNGLAFSPDESILYINDSRRRHIRAFDVDPDGLLMMQTDRVFCDLSGERPGAPDGMKVDVEGNVYCGGSGGVWVIDPNGKLLGILDHGGPSTTNLAFGGDDWKTLFVTQRDTLVSINLKAAGIPVPRGSVS